ncbi:RHS repeat-associated core domain-containing protein [Pseudomonas granadensis]|uniref:RHS repeat-associated core domain-containing protein n=1 Tax=Pseudomonas granadensis TaxID=1421430 RepID=UPI001EF1180C|nr:RHS repeat-associated core domain-containing protein [Pseudomonas granadensis]
MNPGIHAQTPNLSVTDNRGLPVRQVAYWREDASEPEARITSGHHDAAGRLVAQRDPRLFADASAPANLATVYSLTGQALTTLSVDSGWRVSLLGEARQPLHGWDGRGSQRSTEYDEQLRPLAVFEHAHDGEPLCAERYGYGGSDPTLTARNQCGQLIRHDDPAGTQLFEQFGLTGGVVQQTRHFLRSLDAPDWPESLPDRDVSLEPGAGATSCSVFNALGETIEQTDAKGHRQFFAQSLAGQLHEVRLQLDKQPQPKTLVNAIQYNAQGQTEQETAGNGVITALHYASEDGRLTRLQARRNDELLQDLHYAYDPVGNVISIDDAALPIRYFANQRIEPINRYGYDSLYQLLKATGWEAGGANQGPSFSAFYDPAAVTQYTQTYRYDRDGNLLELIHEGAQRHGHRLLAAAQSNRCLPVLDGVEPDEEDFRNGFDANGNLLALQPGQPLHWDLRNQLREVRPVERDGAAGDHEQYVYGADGTRLRKVQQIQTNARTLIAEVRYLPNLQIRTHSGTGEALQVVSVQAGRSSVQVLRWESKPPQGIDNDQLRYNLNDHLGSCMLELDVTGQIISHERYHPFGTTAWFAGRREIEASYKTLRYSGKERDATGLYYYGFRYYVAWIQRWLNPDPVGTVDGLNPYKFVKNNPSSGYDFLGLLHKGANDQNEEIAIESKYDYAVRYRGNTEALAAGDIEFSKTNDAAWKLSAKLIKDTIQYLESANPDGLDSFLGGSRTAKLDSGLTVAQSMLRSYKAIYQEIPRYQRGGDLRDQIVYLESRADVLLEENAFVITDDAHRRIFVTELFRSNNVIGRARILIHELSHLVADTEDPFGYPKSFFHYGTSESETASRLQDLPIHISEIHTELREKNPSLGESEQLLASNADTLALFSLLMLRDKDMVKGLARSVDPHIEGARKSTSGNRLVNFLSSLMPGKNRWPSLANRAEQ